MKFSLASLAAFATFSSTIAASCPYLTTDDANFDLQQYLGEFLQSFLYDELAEGVTRSLC